MFRSSCFLGWQLTAAGGDLRNQTSRSTVPPGSGVMTTHRKVGRKMNVYERLEELGLEMPAAPQPAGAYVPAKLSRGFVYASGQTPTVDGELRWRGKVGDGVSEEEAYQAARLAALNCVAELHYTLGDLGRVREIVKVTGYVASASGFDQQPKVINGASELFQELWGDRGRHARAAIGVSELPFGAPVEIEVVAEVEG
jgi:enamine deaminase RidA (YjgF/YER057c/UK114 family)